MILKATRVGTLNARANWLSLACYTTSKFAFCLTHLRLYAIKRWLTVGFYFIGVIYNKTWSCLSVWQCQAQLDIHSLYSILLVTWAHSWITPSSYLSLGFTPKSPNCFHIPDTYTPASSKCWRCYIESRNKFIEAAWRLLCLTFIYLICKNLNIASITIQLNPSTDKLCTFTVWDCWLKMSWWCQLLLHNVLHCPRLCSWRVVVSTFECRFIRSWVTCWLYILNSRNCNSLSVGTLLPSSCSISIHDTETGEKPGNEASLYRYSSEEYHRNMDKINKSTVTHNSVLKAKLIAPQVSSF